MFVLLLACFVIMRVSLDVEKPGAVQHLAEMTHEFVTEQGESIIGHGYDAIELPDDAGSVHPAGQPAGTGSRAGVADGEPGGAAGIRAGDLPVLSLSRPPREWAGYAKQFLGPVWWLSPLLLPIELISHLARVLSLTVRLFAICMRAIW